MQNHPTPARARQAIPRHLRPGGSDRRPRVQLPEDLALDAVETLDLVRAVETATGLSVAEREIAALRTLGDLCDLIVAHAGTGAVPQEVCPSVWLRVVRSDAQEVTDRRLHLTPYMA